MTENRTRYWIRAFTAPVPATISPAVTPDTLRAEYDIRGGVRGKYYRPPARGCGARAALMLALGLAVGAAGTWALTARPCFVEIVVGPSP